MGANIFLRQYIYFKDSRIFTCLSICDQLLLFPCKNGPEKHRPQSIFICVSFFGIQGGIRGGFEEEEEEETYFCSKEYRGHGSRVREREREQVSRLP